MKPINTPDGVSTDWVIGWKAALIAVASDMRTLRFRSVVVGGAPYGIKAKATCRTFRDKHKSPTNSCRCGFNSWNDYSVAVEYMDFYRFLRKGHSYRLGRPESEFVLSVSLLRVGMYGDVIEGTLDAGPGWNKWGYRASDQLVADVFFDDKCSICDNPSRYIGAASITCVGREVLYPISQFCAEHAAGRPFILQSNSLSMRNNVDIHWRDTSE